MNADLGRVEYPSLSHTLWLWQRALSAPGFAPRLARVMELLSQRGSLGVSAPVTLQVLFLKYPQRLDSKPFKVGFNVKKQSYAQFALSSVEPELQKGLCRNSLYRPLAGAHCSSPRCQTALSAHQYVPGVNSRCPTKDPVKLLSVVVARHPVATTLYHALRNPKVWGKLWL